MTQPGAARSRFIDRFYAAARARLARSLELLATGASANASAIRLELYTIVGEAAFLGCTDVAALARQGELAARRIAEDPTAVVVCMRAVRALGRVLDAMEAGPVRAEPTTDERVLQARARLGEQANALMAGAAGRGRVLVVDDSKLSADLLASILADAGFEVASASTAEELERALAAAPPDIAISDVNMPGLDCALVCRRVREAAPAARLVLISGLEEDVLARECQRLDADGYVPRERGLGATLERVLAETAGRAR